MEGEVRRKKNRQKTGEISHTKSSQTIQFPFAFWRVFSVLSSSTFLIGFIIITSLSSRILSPNYQEANPRKCKEKKNTKRGGRRKEKKSGKEREKEKGKRRRGGGRGGKRRENEIRRCQPTCQKTH